MRKEIIKTTIAIYVVAICLALVSCGGKDKEANEDTTSVVETSIEGETSSIVEELTTEEPTTKVEELSTTKVEESVQETTTIVEETTTKEVPSTKEETTKKQESTTKKKPSTTKKETTTPKPTSKPQETTTKKVEETTTQKPIVESDSIKKLKSLHIANMPKEALDFGIKLVEGQGYVIVYGPTYRVEADYVDEDHFGANCRSQYQDICEQGGNVCDGHSKNPYVMNEWTTRKYWGDKDEVTVGYYCYEMDASHGTPIRSQMDNEIQSTYGNYEVEVVTIGTYEGQIICFVYYFKYTP